MAREVDVGILIKARDAAAGVFDKIKESGQKMGRGIDEAAKRAKDGLSAMRGAVVVVNQAMEIAQKVARMVAGAFNQTVGATLAVRAANDQGRRDFEAFTKSIEGVKIALGDVLLPILTGFMNALRPVIDGFKDWLKVNRELVGSGLVEWLVGVGQTLVSVVAVGAKLAAESYYGLELAILATKAAWEGSKGLVASLGENVALAADKLKNALARVADDESAAKLREEAAQARILADTFHEMGKASGDSADKLLAEGARTSAELDSMRDRIDKAALAIQVGIGEGGKNAMKNLGLGIQRAGADMRAFIEAANKVGPTLADIYRLQREQQAQIEAAAEKAHQKDLARASNLQKMENANANAISAAKLEVEEKVREAQRISFEKAKQEAQEYGQIIISGAAMLGSSLAESFAQIAQGTKNTGEMFAQMGMDVAGILGDMLMHFLANAAATAFANAIAGYSAIPFVGLALGLAAAGTAVALIKSAKFHDGGIIPGPRGMERLAVVQAGEMVVPLNQVGAAQSAGFGAGGSPSGGGWGGPSRVIVETVLPSRVMVDRTEHDYLSKARIRAKKRGWEI